MKLDPTVMRTMNSQDFVVLEAVEKGMKNHALVPLPLVNSIANLKHTHKIVSSLLRDKLLSHEQKRNSYSGYRLTNAGHDILALHHLKQRGLVAALGQCIGTGKESDIYLAANPQGQQVVLKFHRLGRTSFRNVKLKRDYFGNKAQQAHSWLFLSRLSALKEYAFMKALHQVHYPTPTPLAHNRHVVVMSLVRGLPLYQIYPKQLDEQQAESIYSQSVNLAVRLAQHGLVHCDLNEFNLLVDLSGIQSLATDNTHDPFVRHTGSVAPEASASVSLSRPAWLLQANNDQIETVPTERLPNGQPKPVVTLIDFPQMISTSHPNAQELYQRDLNSLRRFFEMKLQCTIPPDNDTCWEDICCPTEETRLDAELRASGYSPNVGRGLELYYFDNGPGGGGIQPLDDEQDDSGDGDHVEELLGTPHVGHVNSDCSEQEEVEPLADTTSECAELVVDTQQLESIARDRIAERAKESVRRQIEQEQRKSKKKGAFKTRNSNKTYVKGKRVLAGSGF